jgi:hypothetical protein
MEARVTAQSQAYRLRERMTQADVQHGHEIRADLPGIGVTARAGNWFSVGQKEFAEIFFCTMGSVRVRNVSIQGDGRSLPGNVMLDGLEVPGDGTYDLINVLVRSNGDLRLIVDDATRVVRVSRTREASLAAT